MYFGPLLNQRLIELDDRQKEYKYLAGADPWCPWWEAAEEREEAIQAKVSEQAIGHWFSGLRDGWPAVWRELEYGIPDKERVYLTQAERTLAQAAEGVNPSWRPFP